QLSQSEQSASAMAEGAAQTLERIAAAAARSAEIYLLSSPPPIPASVVNGSFIYLGPTVPTNDTGVRTLPMIPGNAGTIPAWTSIQNDLISPRDARYAWVPLYRYHRGDAVAQVILFVCESRENAIF